MFRLCTKFFSGVIGSADGLGLGRTPRPSPHLGGVAWAWLYLFANIAIAGAVCDLSPPPPLYSTLRQ